MLRYVLSTRSRWIIIKSGKSVIDANNNSFDPHISRLAEVDAS